MEFKSIGIKGLGYYVPEKVMTNFDFEKIIDTSDEWIRTRTGIEERRFASAEQATSDLCVEAAKKAKKEGMRVFVLGVGSPKGSPIPNVDGGYMKDRSGQEVMSALNESMCKQVAEAGGGAYIHVDNTNIAQNQLDNEIAKLQKGEIMNAVYSEYDEQFQAVGILLIIVLVIEALILETKSPLFKKIKLFK